MREWKYIGNGTTLELRAESCTGCGACVDVCPHAVFALRPAEGEAGWEGRPRASSAQRAAIRDRELCMECGACARNCPVGAIDVSAGVGCAAAIIAGKLRGTAPTCGCGSATRRDSAKDSAKGCC